MRLSGLTSLTGTKDMVSLGCLPMLPLCRCSVTQLQPHLEVSRVQNSSAASVVTSSVLKNIGREDDGIVLVRMAETAGGLSVVT